MTSTLRHKRSAVPGKKPTTAQLDLGELAINTRDGTLYLKRDNGDGTFTIVVLGAVQSVAGKTGEVTLSAADVGLSRVNNTSDQDKPVSEAMQVALNAKVGTDRRLTTGAGLTGGGPLSADRTLSADIATAAEARAGAAPEKLMTPASVEQHMLANALGWEQTWAQVTRQGNTEYVNATGRPILVSYYDTSSSQCRLSTAAPGQAWTVIATARYGVSSTAIIPAGWRYMFSYRPDFVAVLS